MDEREEMLRKLASDFADVIPAVDKQARHERWKPGLGPFEEERQLELILDALSSAEQSMGEIDTEVPYPDSGNRCDLFVRDGASELPVEVKLLRFRRDNGNIDPNMYKSIFSPFPERSSSSLLTDSRKLVHSGFSSPYGLLGLYYEKKEEPYEQLTAATIADKFERDVRYWYDIDIDTVAIAPFEGLQHPHHQHGAVITWKLLGE